MSHQTKTVTGHGTLKVWVDDAQHFQEVGTVSEINVGTIAKPAISLAQLRRAIDLPLPFLQESRP